MYSFEKIKGRDGNTRIVLSAHIHDGFVNLQLRQQPSSAIGLKMVLDLHEVIGIAGRLDAIAKAMVQREEAQADDKERSQMESEYKKLLIKILRNQWDMIPLDLRWEIMLSLGYSEEQIGGVFSKELVITRSGDLLGAQKDHQADS